LPKDDAEMLLMAEGGSSVAGKFLFRSKGHSTNEFIVSMIYKGSPCHHSLKRLGAGEEFVLNKKTPIGCTTLQDARRYLSTKQRKWPQALTTAVLADADELDPEDERWDEPAEEKFEGFEENMRIEDAGMISPTSPTLQAAMKITVEPVLRTAPTRSTMAVSKKERTKTWRKKKLQALHDSFNAPTGFGDFGNLVGPSHQRLIEQGRTAAAITRKRSSGDNSTVFAQSNAILLNRMTSSFKSMRPPGRSAASLTLGDGPDAEINTDTFATAVMTDSPRGDVSTDAFGSSFLGGATPDVSSDPTVKLPGFAADPEPGPASDPNECTFLGNCQCRECVDGW